MQTVVKTLKIRVKDKHTGVLRRMARDVNQVFNFVNETTVLGCFVPSLGLLDEVIDRYMSGKNDAMQGDKQ